MTHTSDEAAAAKKADRPAGTAPLELERLDDCWTRLRCARRRSNEPLGCQRNSFRRRRRRNNNIQRRTLSLGEPRRRWREASASKQFEARICLARQPAAGTSLKRANEPRALQNKADFLLVFHPKLANIADFHLANDWWLARVALVVAAPFAPPRRLRGGRTSPTLHCSLAISQAPVRRLWRAPERMALPLRRSLLCARHQSGAARRRSLQAPDAMNSLNQLTRKGTRSRARAELK